ncbi:MAG: DUF1987 domain-containing protein [Bacteroidota bacterium]
MTSLIIGAKDDITPGVTLDSTKGVFEITGWSHPEDAIAFYSPVFQWLNEYEKNPNASTDFHFRFQYFNTSSAKQIFRLISLLEDVAKKSKAKIHWHHDNEDTDMLASGERFSKMSTVPFEFISH